MHTLKNSNLLKTESFINGKWISKNQTFEVKNPCDGTLLAHVSDMGKKEAKQAIEAASKAFETWKMTSAKERGEILKRWSELITENWDDLSTILTLEQGKPFEQATHELMGSCGFLNWYSEECKRVQGYTALCPDPNRRFMTIKQPIGVVGAITPWNFPLVLLIQKCAPALAVGCTIILKPAEDTPLSALAQAYLAQEAGIPPGVFNVLACKDPQEVGAELTSNRLVRKISFTGSTEVGKKILGNVSKTVKNTTMELGGNCPVIIFDDADIDLAAQQTFWFKMYNAGQCCNNINRFIIHESVYESFVEKYLKMMKEHVRLGPGMDPQTVIGPLINEEGISKVKELVKNALSCGAKACFGGKALEEKGPLFYEPTLLTEMNPKMRMYTEEIFGPVAACYRFSTEEEAVSMANDTHYGLAAYFFTENIGRTYQIAEALEAGSIGINSCDVASELLPFGGWKESGLGRENGLIGSMDSFLENKAIIVGAIEKRKQQ